MVSPSDHNNFNSLPLKKKKSSSVAEYLRIRAPYQDPKMAVNLSPGLVLSDGRFR